MTESVLLVTGIYPPDIGGPATYSKKMLGALKKAKHETHILTLGDKKDTKDVTYISKEHSFFKRAEKVKKYIEESDYDVIYVQDPFSIGYGVAKADTQARKVMKIVGDNVWEISRDVLGVTDGIDEFQKKMHGPKIWLMKQLQTWTANQMDAIITPSKYLKGIITVWGVDEDKVTVIYNALEFDTTSLPSKAEQKKQLELTGTNYIFVGRLAPWKGVDTLIEIFKERKENLIVIGDGTEYEKLKKQSEQYENIQLLGKLPNNKVHKYIYASDGIILNSGYEGLPHVIIEAYMLGTPAMISNIGGNPEIVEDKKTGRLFEYDNKKEIKESIDDLNKNGKQYAKNAEKTLKKFSWSYLLGTTSQVLFAQQN